MHRAARSNSIEVLEYMFEEGNWLYLWHETPLHVYARSDEMDINKFLYLYARGGLSFRVPDKNGDLALDIIADKIKQEYIMDFLSEGKK